MNHFISDQPTVQSEDTSSEVVPSHVYIFTIMDQWMNKSFSLSFVINDRQYKRRRTVDQAQGTRDFNVENPPKVEGKKPRASSSKSSLYRVRLQTSEIYNFFYPKTMAYMKYI